MDTTVLARNWGAIAIRGIAAILFGLLTFVLPGLTLAALILLFGAYALVDGVFSIIAAVRRPVDGPPWWALLVEGLVGIAAGIVAFALPGLTALTLVYLIAAWAMVTGVLEIVAAMRLRRHVTGEWRLAVSGVLSIVFGALMMIAPGAGALAMTLWIGAYAIVFGALLLALALRLRKVHSAPGRVSLPRAA